MKKKNQIKIYIFFKISNFYINELKKISMKKYIKIIYWYFHFNLKKIKPKK